MSSTDLNEISCEYFRFNTNAGKEKFDGDKSDTLCNRNPRRKTETKCSKETANDKNERCLSDETTASLSNDSARATSKDASSRSGSAANENRSDANRKAGSMSDAKSASNHDDECLLDVRNDKCSRERPEKSARPHGEAAKPSRAAGQPVNDGEQMSEFKESKPSKPSKASKEFKEQPVNERPHQQSNETLMKLDYEKATAIRELKTDQNQLESFINSSDKDANGMTNDTTGAHSGHTGSMSNDDANDGKHCATSACATSACANGAANDRNAKSIMKSKVSSKNTKLNGRLSGKHLISNPMHRANSVGENINEFRLARDGRSTKGTVKRSASETVLHFDDYDVAADDELEDEEEEDEQRSDRLSFRNFNKPFDKRPLDKKQPDKSVGSIRSCSDQPNASNANSPTAPDAKSITGSHEDDSSLLLSANLSFNHQNSSYCLDTYSFKKEQLSQARKVPDQVLDFFSSDEQSLIEPNQSSKQPSSSLLNEPALDLETEEQATDQEDETQSSNQIDLLELRRKLERDVLDKPTAGQRIAAQCNAQLSNEYFERDSIEEAAIPSNQAINENYNLPQNDDELESASETPNEADAPDSFQAPADDDYANDYEHSDDYPNDGLQTNYDGNDFQSSSEFENELMNHGRIPQQQRHHITSLENLFSLETIEEQDEEDYSLKDQSLRSNLSQQVASRPQIDSQSTSNALSSHDQATNEDVSNAELSNAELTNAELSNHIEQTSDRDSLDHSEGESSERAPTSQPAIESATSSSQLSSTRKSRPNPQQLINDIYLQVCFEEDSLNDGPADVPSEASESVDYKRYRTFKRDLSLEEQEDDQTLSNGRLLSNDYDSLPEDEHFNSLSECAIDENVTIDDQQMVLVKRPTNETPANCAEKLSNSRARIVKPVQTKPSPVRASQPIKPVQAVRPIKLANCSSRTNKSSPSDKVTRKQPPIKPEICKRSSLINKNIEQLDKSKKRVSSMMQFSKIEPRTRVSDLALRSPKIIKSAITSTPLKAASLGSIISSVNGSAKLNATNRELSESGVHMDQLIEENQSNPNGDKCSPVKERRKFANCSASSHLSNEGSSGVDSGPSSDDIDQPCGKQFSKKSPDPIKSDAPLISSMSSTKLINSVRQARPLLRYVDERTANEAAKPLKSLEKENETRSNELSKSRSLYNVDQQSKRFPDHLATDHRLSSEEFKRRRRSYEVNLDCLEQEHQLAAGRGLKDLRRKSTNYLLNQSFTELSNDDIAKIKRELIRRSEERLARFETSISSRSNSAINSVNNSMVESLPTNSVSYRSNQPSRAKSQNSIGDYDDSVNHSKSSDENLDDYQNKRISRKDINEKWRETLKRSDSLDSLNSIKSINSLGSLNYEELANLKGISRKRIKSSNLTDDAGRREQTSEDEYDYLTNADHYVVSAYRLL